MRASLLGAAGQLQHYFEEQHQAQRQLECWWAAGLRLVPGLHLVLGLLSACMYT